jgi:hypothetical protein
MRPLVARCHLGLAEIHHSSGACDRAREHLAVATAMFREMRMRYWLQKADALA